MGNLHYLEKFCSKTIEIFKNRFNTIMANGKQNTMKNSAPKHLVAMYGEKTRRDENM